MSPNSGFEVLNPPGEGAVAILRLYSRELLRNYCNRYLELEPTRKLHHARSSGDGESLLVVDLPQIHELHVHGGAANVQVHVERLQQLSAQAGKLAADAVNEVRRLWETCFAQTWHHRGIEYLLSVYDPPRIREAAWDIEGFDFLRPVSIALVGPANSGKSTLFNRLAGEGLALVSASPGTTRDPVRALLEWDGFAVELVDTAGWGTDEHDEIQRQSMALSSEILNRSELLLWMSPETLPANLSKRALRVQSKADVDNRRDGVDHYLSAHDSSGIPAMLIELKMRVARLRPALISPRFDKHLTKI